MTIFLTAPLDVQQSPAYESALNLLIERHGHDQLVADRGLFSDFKSYGNSWKQVYDPEKAEGLYVLAREDGTIGNGVYSQYRRLSENNDAPATLLLPHGEQAEEAGEFTVSLIEESERSNRKFAVVSPAVSDGGKQRAAGESPRKGS